MEADRRIKNRLIHGYFVVDYDIVWNIVIKDIPRLKTAIKRILEEFTNLQRKK